MRGLWDFLQDPELVARFQRRCGLFLVVGAPHAPGKEKGTAVPNGTRINGETTRGHLKARLNHQDRNCNYKHTGNGGAAVSPLSDLWPTEEPISTEVEVWVSVDWQRMTGFSRLSGSTCRVSSAAWRVQWETSAPWGWSAFYFYFLLETNWLN